MIDTFTVLQKELREVVGERVSRRGGLVQSVIGVGIFGLLLPAQQHHLWLEESPLGIIYFGIAGIFAAPISADAFAGEQERKTLDTLLATPLSERAILLGKSLASIIFGVTIVTVALIAGVVMVNIVGHPPTPFIPHPIFLLASLTGGASSATLFTSLAILLSTKVPVVRSVQQIMSLAGIGLFGAVAAIWRATEMPLTFENLLVVHGGVFLAGLLLLEIGRATFRRDRIFDRR